MSKKILAVLLVVTLLFSGLFAACGGGEVEQDEIVIGASRDITGPQAGF